MFTIIKRDEASEISSRPLCSESLWPKDRNVSDRIQKTTMLYVVGLPLVGPIRFEYLK